MTDPKEINIKLSATNNADAAFKQVEAGAKRMQKTLAEPIYGPVYKSARITDRGGEEQQARNIVAARLTSERDERKRALVVQRADEIQFERTGKVGGERSQAEVLRDRMKALGVDGSSRTKIAKEAKVTGEAGGKAQAEGFIKSLKSGLGEDSSLGQVGKILAGAGAVAGITIIGRQLDAAITKAGDLTLQLDRGDISAGEMAEQLGKSLPIYGSLVSAGRNFRNILDGTAVEADRINRALERITIAKNVGAEIKAFNKEFADSTMNLLRQLKRERDALFNPPFRVRGDQIKDEAEDRLKGIKERAEKARAEITKLTIANQQLGASVDKQQADRDAASDRWLKALSYARQDGLSGQAMLDAPEVKKTKRDFDSADASLNQLIRQKDENNKAIAEANAILQKTPVLNAESTRLEFAKTIENYKKGASDLKEVAIKIGDEFVTKLKERIASGIERDQSVRDALDKALQDRVDLGDTEAAIQQAQIKNARERAEREAEINRLLKDRKSLSPDNVKRLEAEKANLPTTYKAKADAETESIRQAKADAIRSMEQTIESFREDNLRREGQLTGNLALNREADRLALKNMFDQRKVELTRLSQDPNLPKSDRDAVAKQLADLPGQLAKAIAGLGQSSISRGDVARASLTPVVDGSALSGHSMAVVDGLLLGQNPVEKAQIATAKSAEKTAERIGEFMRVFVQYAQANGSKPLALPN